MSCRLMRHGSSDTPRCPKCAGCLTHGLEYNELQAEQVVKCIECGWRISRPAPRGYKDIKLASVKYDGNKNKQNYAAGRVGQAGLYSICRVESCSRSLRDTNVSGLCKTHMRQQQSWERTKRLYHPPFVERSDGSYQVNPLAGTGRKHG